MKSLSLGLFVVILILSMCNRTKTEPQFGKPEIPGMEGIELPPGIFSHGPQNPADMIEEATIVKERVEVVVDMVPNGHAFRRNKRSAKGGGGRLPNRNG